MSTIMNGDGNYACVLLRNLISKGREANFLRLHGQDDSPTTRTLTLFAIDTRNILDTCHSAEGCQAYMFLVCAKGSLLLRVERFATQKLHSHTEVLANETCNILSYR